MSGLNDRSDLLFSVEGAGAAGGDLADAKLTISRKFGGELVPVDRLAFDASDPDPINAPAIDDNSGLGNDAFLRVDSGSFQDLFIQVKGVNGTTGSYRLVIDDLTEAPSGSALPAPNAFLL